MSSTSSTTSLGIAPLDSDINSITAVAQAQGFSSGAPSKTKCPPGAQAGKPSNLRPISEAMSESSDIVNDASSASEDAKTLPTKKLKTQKKKDVKVTGNKKDHNANGIHPIKSKNLSNISVAKSSSSIMGSKVNGRKQMEVCITNYATNILHFIELYIQLLKSC